MCVEGVHLESKHAISKCFSGR